MNHLTKKERKALSKEKKQAQKKAAEEVSVATKRRFSLTLIISILLAIAFIGLISWIIRENQEIRSIKPVHWHMPISYEFCGKPFTPVEKKEHGLVHGHSDGLAHVEGKIINDQSITLGKFMDTIGMPFNKDKISTYNNGDTCPDSTVSGKVKVLIDGKNNTEFRDHIFNNKEAIKIIFE